MLIRKYCHMKSFLLVLGFVLLWMTGCRSSVEREKLGDARWELETLNDKNVVLSDPESVMFILFDEEARSVNGRAACNRFFGNFELEGSRLRFSPMGATRMHCPDMKWETRFFRILESVDAYSVCNNRLSLSSQGKVVAVFRKAVENK